MNGNGVWRLDELNAEMEGVLWYIAVYCWYLKIFSCSFYLLSSALLSFAPFAGRFRLGSTLEGKNEASTLVDGIVGTMDNSVDHQEG